MEKNKYGVISFLSLNEEKKESDLVIEVLLQIIHTYLEQVIATAIEPHQPTYF